MSRSQIHMLRVLAMRFEDNAPKEMVQTLRKFSRELEARQSDGRTGSAAEERRIDRQRTLFNMLPSGNAADRLKAAMLQRAYDLMWDGDGQGCDAIAEFLPSDDVDRMFDAWSSDWEKDGPRSQFYEGRSQ